MLCVSGTSQDRGKAPTSLYTPVRDFDFLGFWDFNKHLLNCVLTTYTSCGLFGNVILSYVILKMKNLFENLQCYNDTMLNFFIVMCFIGLGIDNANITPLFFY